jgi:hypothetical protein
MPWFRCFVRGERFPLTLEGKLSPTGFYTTRFVEVSDSEEAEEKVVDLLRRDAALSVPAGTPGMEGARIFVEEIEQVEAPGAPNAGFTFFRED